MYLAINSKIARNIVVVVINIKTKCLKTVKNVKKSRLVARLGWLRVLLVDFRY